MRDHLSYTIMPNFHPGNQGNVRSPPVPPPRSRNYARSRSGDGSFCPLTVASVGHSLTPSVFFSMNAAAALYLSDLAKNYAQGVEMAKTALAAGRAYEKLVQLREMQGRA